LVVAQVAALISQLTHDLPSSPFIKPKDVHPVAQVFEVLKHEVHI